jgi:hypothetical protein
LHGLDTSDPAAPKVVHGVLPRDAGIFSIKETWDVLGMCATRSDDTILESAFVPDKYTARVVPMGFAGADLFVLGIFAWALTGFGNIYSGLARRVLEVTVEQVKSRGSIALTRSMAHHPEVQTTLRRWSGSSKPSALSSTPSRAIGRRVGVGRFAGSGFKVQGSEVRAPSAERRIPDPGSLIPS